MKDNLWVKTLLYIYKYIDNIVCAIDKLVEQEALNSFYYSVSSSKDNSVLAVSNRIIDLSDRKIHLFNLKVLIESCLKKVSPINAKILIERYVDNDKSEDIAKRFNLPIRTYFRHLKKAENDFYFFMIGQKFDNEKLSEYLKEEKWIIDVYNSFLNRKLI